MAGEQNIRMTGDSSGFRKQFEDLRKEYEAFNRDLEANGGKFDSNLQQRHRTLIANSRLASAQEQQEYRRENNRIEEGYRSGVLDSRDRRNAREDNAFEHATNREEVNDLILELRNLNTSVQQETRSSNDVYKAFANERLINYGVGIASKISTTLTGTDTSGIVSASVAAYNKGDTLQEKAKYGIIGFGLAVAVETFTKSLENTVRMYDTVNKTVGIGALGSKSSMRDINSDNPYVNSMADLGINANDATRKAYSFATTTGYGANIYERTQKATEIERALSLSEGAITQISSFDRMIKKGDGSDATLKLLNFLNGTDSKYSIGQNNSDLSSLGEKISLLSQVMTSQASIYGSVDANSSAAYVAAFAKLGDNQTMGQNMAAFQSGMSSQNPAYQMLAMRTAQEMNPDADIVDIQRMIAGVGKGEQGMELARRILKNENSLARTPLEKKMLAFNQFGGATQNAQDAMLSGDFLNVKEGGGFTQEGMSGKAKDQTMSIDVNKAKIFNATANIGDEVVEAIDTVVSGITNLASALSSLKSVASLPEPKVQKGVNPKK